MCSSSDLLDGRLFQCTAVIHFQRMTFVSSHPARLCGAYTVTTLPNTIIPLPPDSGSDHTSRCWVRTDFIGYRHHRMLPSQPGASTGEPARQTEQTLEGVIRRRNESRGNGRRRHGTYGYYPAAQITSAPGRTRK